MSREAIEAVVELIEMGAVVGNAAIVRCLRSALDEPQPASKPLTDEQIKAMWLQLNPQALIAFARAIEAAHGIKENT